MVKKKKTHTIGGIRGSIPGIPGIRHFHWLRRKGGPSLHLRLARDHFIRWYLQPFVQELDSGQ